MPPSAPRAITQLLAAAEAGEPGARDHLLDLVYDELRRMACERMRRERRDHTLQPTALVHEAYLRLLGPTSPHWDSRAHFFAAAAEAMRRVLVEAARARAAVKRGGNTLRVTLGDVAARKELAPEELLDLDRALARLETLDPAMAQVVKLRYFTGLSAAETARVLGTSLRSVERQWAAARAWLQVAAGGGSRPAPR